MTVVDQQDTEGRIAELEHEAAVARQNPPPREAEERRRRADQLDQEAAGLRERLAEHLRAQHLLNVAARNANQVRVRFTRDLGPGAVSVGDYVVAPAHGPIRQRRTSAAAGEHPLQSKGIEVELEPGEERVMPATVAQVLVDAGYLQVLGPVEAPPEAAG